MTVLDDWTYYMKEISDVDDAFIEASGLYLISTFCGRRYQILVLSDISARDQPTTQGRLLNLWFIFLAKSRIGRKTTIINKVKDIVYDVDERLILPVDFTPHSITTQLLNQYDPNTEQTIATWINDECSGFFEQLGKKESYMTTADTTLSQIYDGNDHWIKTHARGDEKIKNPYLTILVASTPDTCKFFTDSMIGQGFFNRFIPILLDKYPQYRPASFHGLSIDSRIRLKYIKEWLRMLYKKSELTILKPNTEAIQIWNQYDKKVYDYIMTHDLGVSESFYGNLPNTALKIAGLYRISRLETITEELGIEIEAQDVQKAITYVDKMWIWFKQLTHRRFDISPQRISTIEGYINKLTEILERNSGHLPRWKLLNKMKMLAQTFDNIINTMLQTGLLFWVRTETGGIEYYLPEAFREYKKQH